jgi:serine/threonine-protein kinase
MTEPLHRLSAALASRYRFERELGAGVGGMGTVYLVHDLRLDREVALKVIKPDVAVDIGVEQFLTEITTTAHLQHPHILPLYDSGEADGGMSRS